MTIFEDTLRWAKGGRRRLLFQIGGIFNLSNKGNFSGRGGALTIVKNLLTSAVTWLHCYLAKSYENPIVTWLHGYLNTRMVKL